MARAALGIPTAAIRRNVRDCWNLGYCGMGCPTNAKQSMLVTCIPDALGRGARLFTRLRAERVAFVGNRVDHVACRALRDDGLTPSGATLTVRARHVVLAGGAINTPGILLRSETPDPYERLGRRTFLHPTTISAARMDERVDGHAGAPQSVFSDHFLDSLPIDGPIGFKLEAAPLHPVLFATTLHGFGAQHAALMREFGRSHVLLALLRDGFHVDSPGGRVLLDGQQRGARLPDQPGPVGRRAPRAAGHGRDPVRGRRAAGVPGARTGRRAMRASPPPRQRSRSCRSSRC